MDYQGQIFSTLSAVQTVKLWKQLNSSSTAKKTTKSLSSTDHLNITNNQFS